MDANPVKCAMVIDGGLPVGLQVNTAGVLAFTLGRELGEVVGPEVVDGSGRAHAGITRIPIPVLEAEEVMLREIREKAGEDEGLLVVDFTDAAQTSKTYDEYEEKMAAASSGDLRYLGVALTGTRSPSTGSPAACRCSGSSRRRAGPRRTRRGENGEVRETPVGLTAEERRRSYGSRAGEPSDKRPALYLDDEDGRPVATAGKILLPRLGFSSRLAAVWTAAVSLAGSVRAVRW